MVRNVCVNVAPAVAVRASGFAFVEGSVKTTGDGETVRRTYSVTCVEPLRATTSKSNVPAVVGVPLSTPVSTLTV